MRPSPLISILVVLNFIVGCNQSAVSDAELAPQVTEVRERKSDRIHIEDQPLADRDLASLAELHDLRELLIDHPQSVLTPQGLSQLQSLEKLEHLRIRGPLADDALSEICKLKQLRILNLPHGSFSDASLTSLLQLERLQQLRLGSPNISDEGVKTLAQLPAIKQVHLIDASVSDQGLAALAAIDGLESLYIDGGQFSDAALDKLFREHPKLHVHFNQQHHDRDPQGHEHPAGP